MVLAVLAAGGAAGSTPARTGACPKALAPGAEAAQFVLSAAERLARQREVVVALGSLDGRSPALDDVWRGIAANRCGAAVARRSWVVFTSRPNAVGSASLAQGVSYFVRTPSGWRRWYVYR